MTDTRREAIERLIEAVESDGLISNWGNYGLRYETAVVARKAHEGSIDAAKELHEAVLSGWLIDTYETLEGHRAVLKEPIISETTGAFVGRQSHGVSVHGEAPARLLAILRALASEEGGEA